MEGYSLLVVVGLVAGFMGGAMSRWMLWILAPEAIRARQFWVVDKAGNNRAALSEDGVLALFDKNGKPRVMLNERGPVFSDENGKTRALVWEDRLAFFDESGKLRVGLTELGLVFHDESGKVIFKVPPE